MSRMNGKKTHTHMVITYIARVWVNHVRSTNPAFGQLNRKNEPFQTTALVPRVIPCGFHHAGGLRANLGNQSLKLAVLVELLEIVVAADVVSVEKYLRATKSTCK